MGNMGGIMARPARGEPGGPPASPGPSDGLSTRKEQTVEIATSARRPRRRGRILVNLACIAGHALRRRLHRPGRLRLPALRHHRQLHGGLPGPRLGRLRGGRPGRRPARRRRHHLPAAGRLRRRPPGHAPDRQHRGRRLPDQGRRQPRRRPVDLPAHLDLAVAGLLLGAVRRLRLPRAPGPATRMLAHRRPAAIIALVSLVQLLPRPPPRPSSCRRPSAVDVPDQRVPPPTVLLEGAGSEAWLRTSALSLSRAAPRSRRGLRRPGLRRDVHRHQRGAAHHLRGPRLDLADGRIVDPGYPSPAP